MILVTNDDGIFAPGLWAMAGALRDIDRVVVVAPDREQSAIGTAMTLRRPLRVRQAHSIVDEVEAYAVDGTPGDSVIVAAGKLFEGQIDLVVSGINEGFNLGDDVLISGTVGAALQGYLRGIPAIALSTAGADGNSLKTAARLGSLIARHIKAGNSPGDLLLNINIPDGLLSDINGIAVTRPAHKSHIDGVKDGSDGRQHYYWLVRHQTADAPEHTDIRAISQRLISITPLHTAFFGHPAPLMDESFCQSLFFQLKNSVY